MERIYYLKDEKHVPRVTVCLLKDDVDGSIGRGVSICSFKDQPVRSEGIAKARGRAKQALFHSSNIKDSEILRDEALEVIESVLDDDDDTYITALWRKASFIRPEEINDKLTDFEKSLLKIKE